MKILVTGGTSFVGAPLVRVLAADGDDVRVFSRRTGGDIRDPHAVARAVHGCDSVIHLAYAPVSSPSREIMDTALLGMAAVLRACELHSVRDLMLVSSPRAEDTTYYGCGKLASEMMAQSWFQDGALERLIIARVFNAYGPDMGTDHVIPQFAARMAELNYQQPDGVIPFPVKGSGQDVRSFCYVGNCATQLAVLFRGARTGAYEVGVADDSVTTADLARQTAACFGREIEVVAEQPSAAVTVRVPQPPALLTALPFLPFGTGLRRTVAWYRAHGEVSVGQSLRG